MPLDTIEESESIPAAQFPSVGDSIVVGIVDVGDYQQRDFDSGDPKVWPDGKPMMGKVVTGLVVSTTGTTAKGAAKDPQPVAAGDLVTFWCEGSKHYTYRDAKKAHGAVDIGDVMRWVRDPDEAPKNTRHNPRKVYSAQIRKPKPEESALVDACRAAYDARHAVTVDAGDAWGSSDEEAF